MQPHSHCRPLQVQLHDLPVQQGLQQKRKETMQSGVHMACPLPLPLLWVVQQVAGQRPAAAPAHLCYLH
jgi:hypothetical protein